MWARCSRSSAAPVPNVAAALDGTPVIAWSAGAMALTDRIGLFHHRAPQGPGHPEVRGSGLSMVRRHAVLLPHARARLLLDVAADGRPGPQVRPGPLRAAGDRHPSRSGLRRQLAAGDTGPRRRWPRRQRCRMTAVGPPVAAPPTAGSRKLAINRLRDRKPLDEATVDRFLARHQVPIIEGPRCTFLYRGEADEVFLVHRVFGLPDRLPLRRLHGTGLWHLVLELPEGSRVEYQLQVVRGGQSERINDPLNPNLVPQPGGQTRRCATQPGTRYLTGPCPIRTRGRGRWWTWWCRAARCAGTPR